MMVEAEGYEPRSQQIEIVADTEVAFTLEALAVGPGPLPAVPDIIQASGGQFRLNGQPIRFVGANTRGMVHYGDPDILGGHTRQGDRQAQLDAVSRMGGRVVRVFLANHRRSASVVADRLAQTLQLLDARDLYMIVAFTDVHSDTPFRVQGDEHFYTENGMLNRAFFTGGYRQNYLPFVQHIVERFKDHTRIFAWELGNELKAQDGGNILPDLFTTFAHDVAGEIRALDGVHLITTGIINSGNLDMGAEQAKRLYGDANLNFLTVHVYPGIPNSPEIPRADAEVNIARQVGKPLIIEEIGFENGDRVVKTRAALNKWFDQKDAAGVMQWGLMATPRDNGDGDVRFGMDPGVLPGHHDFEGLVNVYHERANVLGF
jgi:endo-1,4-beta-mannosidase